MHQHAVAKISMNNISFIILTWNSEKHIDGCIRAILKTVNSEKYTYEIFVVDNGSKDNTRNILNSLIKEFPGIIETIFFDHNTGTTFSRNQALKRITGDFICVIDSDVEILEGTIDHLINMLKENDRIGLIAPRLVYGNGRLQKSTDYFPTITRKLYRFFFLKALEKKTQGDETDDLLKKKEVDYAISAFWLFPKKVIKKVGFLDEKIFYAPEDADYCLRLWGCGYKILYDPTVSAIHNAQEISRGFKMNRAFLEHIKGLIYYFLKHHYFFKKPVYNQDL